MRLLEPSGDIRLRLAAIGDVGLIGSARRRARAEGYDMAFAPVAPLLRSADLGIANLEMPVGQPGWVRPGRSSEFWHEAEVAGALARAGVEVVSLANNHIMDCGPRGLERTREACEQAGLLVCGAGQNLATARVPAQLDIRGHRVIVLAYAAPGPDDRATASSPGLAPLDPQLIREDLERWRPAAEVLVVSVHWGSMYVDYPPPRVLKLAELLRDGGADVVLGHHPHVVQGFRRDGRTLTLFSLGDILFNSRAGYFRASVGAEARLETGVFTALVAGEPGLEYEPFRLDDDGFPMAVDGEVAERQRARLERISQGLVAGTERFQREAAPQLLRYELEAIGHYVRQGRIDLIVKLLATVRLRHIGLVWQAIKRGRLST